MKEYFIDPYTGNALYKDESGEVKELTQHDTEIIREHLEHSKNFYPEQYEALCQEYANSSANKPYYDFLRARRLINCCFGEHDNQPDIDEFGNYHFEKVKCPLIAECKYFKIICQPTFSSRLTDSEYKVMELVFRHYSTDEIAERLHLSKHTVNNHRRNSLSRLKLHSIEEFISYAYEHDLFKK